MIYLNTFIFPNEDTQYDFLLYEKRTCYDSFYLFMVLSKHCFERIDFEPITILYGGNGSGKSTALNIIAEKLKLERSSIFNKSNFYDNYLDFCEFDTQSEIPVKSRIITSDDVFDYMLNIRNLNEGIDNKRVEIFDDYINTKYTKFQLKSLDDYEKLKKINDSRRKTQSKYVREHLNNNIRLYSNGENAFKYFLEKIEEGNLYILDEPENSLSPKLQLELVSLIEDFSRYFSCQFIISTHSPFILGIKGSKIYDLDEDPVDVKKWTELENVKIYNEFFKNRQDEF